jgi:nucleoside-diphosphate-sugar epimerase
LIEASQTAIGTAGATVLPNTVVVTGAQGFLGRWVAAALLGNGMDLAVVGLGRSPRTSHYYSTRVSRGAHQVPAPLPTELADIDREPRYDYRRADVTSPADLQSLLNDVRPTVVVHCAAALRDESWADLIATNVVGTAALVQAMAATTPNAHLVLVSSGSVYGASDRLPLRESDSCRPVDPYAVSKRSAEDVARVAAARLGIPLSIGRVFNLVGPGLQERHLPASLAAQLCAIAVGALPPRLRLGALTTTRDYIDVRDAAAAVALLAQARPIDVALMVPGAEAASVVNIGSGRETPVQCILDGLRAAVLNRRSLPNIDEVRLPPRHGDIANVRADTSRLAKLAFRLSYDLGRSLQDMVDYYLDRVLT